MKRASRAGGANHADDAIARARRSQQLLAAVAHDMKNPLGVVMLSAARLMADHGGDGDAVSAHHLETILRSTRRMRRLVDDLLDAVALEKGAISVQPVACDLGMLVAEALREIGPLADEQQVRLISEMPLGHVRVHGDPDRVHQILSNLVGNALKFTARCGVIVVRAQVRGDAVAISVADSGIGIARRHLPHLFDRFWRVPGSSHEGYGLGLAICKSLVELGGGRIEVESELGVGTSVTFTLPTA